MGVVFRLFELEHTRDELLIQLHQGSDAFVDKNTVSYAYLHVSYFFIILFLGIAQIL